jgi:hypothetical protein
MRKTTAIYLGSLLVVLAFLGLSAVGCGAPSTAAPQSAEPAVLAISGVVVSGGDTTPADGPRDAPRQFVFVVKKADGASIEVAYTAYPPSPVADRERGKIELSFYQTPVQAGDFLEARGSYNPTTNFLTVAQQGDYIRTSEKPSAAS